ncbi:hypothetical protein BamIOP4010DRAFT_4324 [Burkholderia ambifaria IOP40-10]|uniref:Uncharacterized protein n=1 Tax=Burkholderia ambifaria IOP40-10 TaxID=396596 RepID=B1FJW3_9BURK|nr:hypothetical protein BamIOP4010DRAFT_4324 [Burkholderia ambifaria IOP40-10]
MRITTNRPIAATNQLLNQIEAMLSTRCPRYACLPRPAPAKPAINVISAVIGSTTLQCGWPNTQPST